MNDQLVSWKAAPVRRQPEDWIRDQTAIDWPARGLPAYPDWDPALKAALNLLAHSPAPMALLIGPRGLLLANDQARKLFCEIGGAFNGRPVTELRPQERASFFGTVLETGLAGRAQSFHARPIRPAAGGEGTLWYNLDVTPVLGSDGRPVAVLCSASDVTAFIRRIHELTESQHGLRLALEGSGLVGIWTLDVASGMAVADANVARTYGLPQDRCETGIPSARFIAAIHAEDRARVSATLAGALAAGTSYHCKYRVVVGAAPPRWVLTSAKPTFDERGKVCRLLGVVVDVTGQMEMAAELEDSRFRFQTLTEALPQIVWSCDAEGRHDYFSGRWSEFTGIEPDAITEETWKELVYPDHWDMVGDVWNRALRTGQAYDIDYRFRHRSGEYRWLRVMALPIRGEDGEITRWFGTSTDVHDAYLLAEERERLSGELRRVATEDALTGMLNRQAFQQQVARLIDRRRGAPPQAEAQASLMRLDLDHFNAINDAHGPEVGDLVLAAAAARLRAALRPQDIVARWGGGEFVVYLPQCPRAEALTVAERVRAALADAPIPLAKDAAVLATVSLGLTTAPERLLVLEAALGTAGRALHLAKAEGRNRAVFQEEAAPA